MLKSIAEVSPDISAFIAIDGDKNLSNLYRHFVGDPCPKSAADTFREAPWISDDFRIPLRKRLVNKAFQRYPATS